MTAATDVTTPRERRGAASPGLRRLLRVGGLGSLVALYVCLVGLVPVFHTRPLVVGIVSLGQASLLVAFGATGFAAARPYLSSTRASMLLWGAAAGALAGILPALLVVLGSVVDIRSVFLNASPDLYTELTLGIGTA
ncbi:MAG: hypothetical protein M3067_08545, partial [Chloroflexota bacterium]|nr:hypothetical protein [Chloroflexota bacterium]